MFELFANDATMMLSGLIFLATAMLALAVMIGIRARDGIRRRVARVNSDGGTPNESRSLQFSGLRAARRLVEYTTKHYASVDGDNVKVLRRRMLQAGIYNPHAIAYYFLARAASALVVTGLVYFALPLVGFPSNSGFWLLLICGGFVGYSAPGFYLDRKVSAKRLEHRLGFPDFMDLLVVSSDAGLSMEAGLDRVRRELSDAYPSLTANIYMAILEIRAGRTMVEALEHFAERLGLDEARSFATLIKQSAELGSSIGDALRIYSDDMRHKRLSRAEEKAYGLPAKLAIPMMLCIFPVLFIVILCPVIVRLATNNW
jgi:tight adherence protein C